IWQLKDSFSGKRHEIGGRKVSLNDIEHGTLRPLIGYRAHAVLVCAARSCPPLQRFAYAGDKFEEQDDRAYRAWLAREDLNKFSPNEKKVEISRIFKWFKADFDKAGGVPKILGRYAPQSVRDFAATGKYETKYLPYNWGLNDQGPHGRNYSRAHLLFDNIFKYFVAWPISYVPLHCAAAVIPRVQAFRRYTAPEQDEKKAIAQSNFPRSLRNLNLRTTPHRRIEQFDFTPTAQAGRKLDVLHQCQWRKSAHPQ